MPWTASDTNLLLLTSVAFQQPLTIRLTRIDRDFDATILDFLYEKAIDKGAAFTVHLPAR